MNLVVRLLYNWLLPLFFLLAAPAWLLRMARRGGLDAQLLQRLGVFRRPAEFEPVGAVYVHAVSVGEVRMALRLIAEWLKHHPEEQFVIAATTSTGFQLAEREASDGVRVIYSPLDLSPIIHHIFNRFEPALIVLIDSELWPNLLHVANRRGIPTALVNARLSPRSARRYECFRVITASLFGQLKLVCAQVAEHAERWSNIGVLPEALVVTGS
ncbi:MAG: glycosyltransferase N-terminal domain-containing protein, partial [Verrucomicrobiota bacterium]|nr:glycosyltransferase N-terminal domain-containing protein [Verrucomicrobiota bacterium]